MRTKMESSYFGDTFFDFFVGFLLVSVPLLDVVQRLVDVLGDRMEISGCGLRVLIQTKIKIKSCYDHI